MNKRKMGILFAICFSIFVVFAVLVVAFFHSVSKNPIDNLSIPYIRSCADIQNQYGEITSIGRNILYTTEKTETSIKAPYTIQTETGRVITYVTLVKNDGKWEAVSLEIIEVISNE